MIQKMAFPSFESSPEPIRKRSSKDKRERIKYIVRNNSNSKSVVTTRQNFYTENDSLVWSVEIESDSSKNNEYIRGQRMVNNKSTNSQQIDFLKANKVTTSTSENLENV